MTTIIKFKYIIGGNIELDVEARIIPDEPEVNFIGGADILSVALNGVEVETEDVLIRDKAGIAFLDTLLEEAAMERAAEEKGNA